MGEFDDMVRELLAADYRRRAICPFDGCLYTLDADGFWCPYCGLRRDEYGPPRPPAILRGLPL